MSTKGGLIPDRTPHWMVGEKGLELVRPVECSCFAVDGVFKGVLEHAAVPLEQYTKGTLSEAGRIDLDFMEKSGEDET